jgi:hypothetical protein
MMDCLKNLEDEISAWPHVSIHPHRFGGRKFRFGNAEVGRMHTGAVVDIPFSRSIPMRCWTKVGLTSTIGFPIRVGSLSAFGAR